MRWRRYTIVLLTALLFIADARAENSIVVESKTVAKGASNVEIRIHITNDVPLRGLIVPLDIRKVTPGTVQPFITRVSMSFDERLSGSALSDIVVTNQYERRMHFCPENGCVGYDTPMIASTPGESHPVQGTPEGVMFTRLRMFSPPLLPGADILGSMYLTVDVTEDLGVFEIDTMCTWECNNVAFIKDTKAPYEIIKPAFTLGTITIACDCPYQGDINANGFVDSVDLGFIIDAIFFGGPDPEDPSCPTPRGDLNIDRFTDSLDLGIIIDLIFFGGANPADPCA